jgi:hypothetical protein
MIPETADPVGDSTVVDPVEIRHIDDAIADHVRAFFAGKVRDFVQDGDRSVRFAHPLGGGLQLKIKGAGMNGGAIQFGTQHKAGPKAPLFDFDGRMMEDVASGHDNAYVGGATFQQAATEYRVSNLLASLGYSVVPCLGFGRVERAGLSSWFSVFEMRSDWASVKPPEFSLEDYCEAKLAIGHLLLELAMKHDLIGHAWYVGKPGGQRYIKDVHPFRTADPVSMSQLSWVMQLFFALHIVSLAAVHFSKTLTVEMVPEDIQALCFRAILPTASKADHQALRKPLVARYMLGKPQLFDQGALVEVLRGNPITQAMLELCPSKYERY